MVKKAKGKQRLDKFARLAKDAGLRSRAAFKLTQLDAKFSFLSSSRAVLDLCAAPGGWAQIAVQRAPVASLVVAVDLDPIRPIRGVHTLIHDITTPKCRAAIKRLMDDNGCKAFDLVLHDGSPNMGGNWQSEATTQSALVVEALRLATQFLAAKGTFVTKIFRSQDYDAVRFCLKQLFEKVEITKPPASRSTSAEIYAICLKYKAPAKIDPRLLDMKHLFQGAVEAHKVVDVLGRTPQKRRDRGGYEDGITVIGEADLVSKFVWSETPTEILGSVYTLTFEDQACLPIKDHELTTEEIKSLCEDLRVLDKNDFKHLLKWRMRIRKALSSDQKIAPKAANADSETKPDGDDSLLNEMEELKNVLERKNKREKKIIAKRRDKDKLRKATGMQIDATEDSYNDHELFSLSQMKGKKDLLAISSSEVNNEDYGDLGDSDTNDPDAFVNRYDSTSDLDSDEEHKRYDDQLDEMLDHAYERYLTRKGGRTKTSKRIKRVISDDTELDGVDDEDIIHQDNDSDQDQSDKEANPLMVPLHEDDQPTEEQKENKWYNQDVFTEAVDEGVFEKSDSEEEEKEPSFEVSKKSDRPLTLPPKDSKSLTTKAMQQEEFEVVPEEPMQSSDDSSSDESEDLDDDQKAEILAFAKKMLRKKQREQIIDDAYNKYMYDDENLPNWFAHEEKRHWQAIKPVTKEEVAEMKAQFREIDTRPIKKIAEAKARKKRTAMKKLEKVRHKADSISDQTDLPERSKRKMIDQLYKKAIPKRPKKEYVVAKKGVQVKPGKGKVLVDRRMKKDARSQGTGKAKGAKAKGNGAKRKGSAMKGGKGGGRK